MKSEYFLAIDIGASSGRHILGSLGCDGRLSIEEVHRFRNAASYKGGKLCWDTDYLFAEILNGIKKCGEIGKVPASLAIDTWGVDFVLLNKDGKMAGPAVSYRDKRTVGMAAEVYKIIPKNELYQKTGIQNTEFNTIYQLYSIRESDELKGASAFLMIPDYFSFLLTGKRHNEYTNASTTQLLNARTCKWDEDVLAALKISKGIFQEIDEPGAPIGSLKADIREIVGFDAEVISAPSHDTASAVLAVPSEADNFAFMSSGTWSLLGTESDSCNTSPESLLANFTNEGGYGHKYRYLKNIMGLWIIQNIKKELGGAYSFDDLSNMAQEFSAKDEGGAPLIDVNDNAFFSPPSMIEAIKDYCKNRLGREVSEIAEIAAIVYRSLADSYCGTIRELEGLSGKKLKDFFIIGGGSQDKYLNALTARNARLNVFAGPVEATAIGNILCQMLRRGIFGSVKDARKCVFNSFNIEECD